MKKFIITSILAALLTAGMAQDYPDEYLGLPGDNLNLYAVMKLFQESETLEGFERSLNDQNSTINNLDLNGDNLVDYINVIDYVDGDVHTIVLRAILNRNETQDVAVFTVQRFNDGSVQIQLVGDEDLYGRNYIIEPIYDDYYAETPNPGYTGRSRNRTNITVIRTTPFEIAAWPLVRFIYMPSYVVWRSSWYWDYYPSYWHPWRPFYWHYYYGYHYYWHPHYYAHYHHWNQHRYVRYNDFYFGGIRTFSPQVGIRIKEGGYKTTYSHPEQRKDGEVLYSRTYSGQNSRRSNYSTISSSEKNPASRSASERSSTGSRSSNMRQSSSTVNSKSGTVRTSDQNAGSSRRASGTSVNRPVTKASSGQNADASRRSSSSVSNRPVTKSSSDQNSSASRRTNPSVSSRSASKSDQGQRGESARTSRSSTKSAGSTGTRSSKESSNRNVSSKGEKSKESSSKSRR